jgi:hypothetical protein
MAKHTITAADIMPTAEYTPKRWEYRRELAAIRKLRRAQVGPFVSLSFESFETMWHQIQEMLYIEKGGETQLAEELEAYEPLVPKGHELVATMMIEIDDERVRTRTLGLLGGIEATLELSFAGETVKSVPEEDIERTRESGKTSSVHFLHFPFTPTQIKAFTAPGIEVVLAVKHKEYRHMTVLSEEMRLTLAADLEG